MSADVIFDPLPLSNFLVPDSLLSLYPRIKTSWTRLKARRSEVRLVESPFLRSASTSAAAASLSLQYAAPSAAILCLPQDVCLSVRVLSQWADYRVLQTTPSPLVPRPSKDVGATPIQAKDDRCRATSAPWRMPARPISST